MTKDPRVYLAQIQERMDRIMQYTAPGRHAFFKDPMMQDAVIRSFEVIGEAAKRVPEPYCHVLRRVAGNCVRTQARSA